jgi:hypothetical protein
MAMGLPPVTSTEFQITNFGNMRLSRNIIKRVWYERSTARHTSHLRFVKSSKRIADLTIDLGPSLLFQGH